MFVGRMLTMLDARHVNCKEYEWSVERKNRRATVSATQTHRLETAHIAVFRPTEADTETTAVERGQTFVP